MLSQWKAKGEIQNSDGEKCWEVWQIASFHYLRCLRARNGFNGVGLLSWGGSKKWRRGSVNYQDNHIPNSKTFVLET